MNQLSENYFAPYFNQSDRLREAYQALHPNYDFDLISCLMVGALSVYVPEEVFDKLVANTLSEATAKLNSTN